MRAEPENGDYVGKAARWVMIGLGIALLAAVAGAWIVGKWREITFYPG